MKICRFYEFAAAHHLPGHPKCGKSHGHNYVVEIEIEGDPDRSSGMVIDFADLDAFVKVPIGVLDHSDLNDKFAMPTAERLAQHFAWVLQIPAESPVGSLSRVRIWENARSWAEWNLGDPLELED